MALVTLFNEFIEVSANKTFEIPFMIDDLSDVVISIGCLDNDIPFGNGRNNEVQARVETEAGLEILPDEISNDNLVFKGKHLSPGNYRLIITVGRYSYESYSKVRIKAQSDLQMETIIIPSTANTEKHGLIQAHLYYKTRSTPIEDATVSVGEHIFDNAGDGYYVSTFPSGFVNESVLINLFARGNFEEIAFQRNHSRVVKAYSGELVFIGPYNWEVTRATTDPSTITAITLRVGVEVKKAGRYGVVVWITDITNDEHAGIEADDWLDEPPASSRKPKASGVTSPICQVV